jgi:pimeloyl-ACP methyl ester carboxylesterase
MPKANLHGMVLECETAGAGEPVVFIHGSFIADTFRPLLTDSRLGRRYRLITYRRRGYMGSTPVRGKLTIEEQAADCQALLDQLGCTRAHVVGHSFGGVVALQLALDAPQLVHSLVLLEPAVAVGQSGVGYRESLANATRRFHDTGASIAVDEFLEMRWPGYREHIETVLPGGFSQAVADAATAFDVEFPALLEWSFDEVQARRIDRPTLSVLGAESEALWPRFGETHRALCSWLPQAEGYILPEATHFLQVQNPLDTAEALVAFFARHPINADASASS